MLFLLLLLLLLPFVLINYYLTSSFRENFDKGSKYSSDTFLREILSEVVR